jgi:hypothetical protein
MPTDKIVSDQLQNLYHAETLNSKSMEYDISVGRISEKDKFLAAKQILFGLSLLYVFTLCAFLLRPDDGLKLLDVCTTTFPPLATLILVAYFRHPN